MNVGLLIGGGRYRDPRTPAVRRVLKGLRVRLLAVVVRHLLLVAPAAELELVIIVVYHVVYYLTLVQPVVVDEALALVEVRLNLVVLGQELPVPPLVLGSSIPAVPPVEALDVEGHVRLVHDDVRGDDLLVQIRVAGGVLPLEDEVLDLVLLRCSLLALGERVHLKILLEASPRGQPVEVGGARLPVLGLCPLLAPEGPEIFAHGVAGIEGSVNLADLGAFLPPAQHDFVLRLEGLELLVHEIPGVLGLVEVLEKLLREIQIQRGVDVERDVLLVALHFLVHHELDPEALDERLPDANVDVEEVQRGVEIGPDAGLSGVVVPLNVEVREVGG